MSTTCIRWCIANRKVEVILWEVDSWVIADRPICFACKSANTSNARVHTLLRICWKRGFIWICWKRELITVKKNLKHLFHSYILHVLLMFWICLVYIEWSILNPSVRNHPVITYAQLGQVDQVAQFLCKRCESHDSREETCEKMKFSAFLPHHRV